MLTLCGQKVDFTSHRRSAFHIHSYKHFHNVTIHTSKHGKERNINNPARGFPPNRHPLLLNDPCRPLRPKCTGISTGKRRGGSSRVLWETTFTSQEPLLFPHNQRLAREGWGGAVSHLLLTCFCVSLSLSRRGKNE